MTNIMFNGSALSTSVDIKKKGVYSLSFTTNIDPEQQPLKQIYINWGDGTEQLITGQDSHSDPANPHLFYHYYSKTGQNSISIKVEDNWGFYRLY